MQISRALLLITAHIHVAADAAFAADELSAVLGAHACAEAEFAGAFHEAAAFGVVR